MQPIVAMAPTPSGHGYWLAAGDGGIFTFGDARFSGSAVGMANQPIVGIATDLSGHGYWLAGAYGAVYTFGDAPNLGGISISTCACRSEVSRARRAGGATGSPVADGGVFSFGDALWFGWPGPIRLAQTIRGVRLIGDCRISFIPAGAARRRSW